MSSSRHLVGFSGLPATRQELAELRAKSSVHRFDLDFDPLSRMPPFRGVGEDPPPQGGLVPLLVFAASVAAGWYLLGAVLPRVGS